MEGAAPSDHSGEAPRRVSVLLHSEHPGVNIEISLSLYIYGAKYMGRTHGLLTALLSSTGRAAFRAPSRRSVRRAAPGPIQ